MITKMGKYLCTFCPDNPRATKEGYVYIHVLVAEKKLGRYLSKEECVHHVDEDKYNNMEENIIVFKSNADHAAFHKGIEAVQDGDVWWCPNKKSYIICPVCGEFKSNKSKMCHTCRTLDGVRKKIEKRLYQLNKNINRIIFDEDFRSQLKKDIRSGNFSEVAKIYGVTDNAIRKWCDKYGLPRHSHIIKLIPDIEWETEEFSDDTINKINEYYKTKSATNDDIINSYFIDPSITRVAKRYNKDNDTIKKILKQHNIRILTASESGNIRVVDIYKDRLKVASFLTTMEAAKWIIKNNYNGNVNIAKNISYKIQKTMNSDIESFGFTFKDNTEILNYKEYLIGTLLLLESA